MGWGGALERVGEGGCELDLVGVWVLWVIDEEKKKREMVNIVLLVIQCSCLWISGYQTVDWHRGSPFASRDVVSQRSLRPGEEVSILQVYKPEDGSYQIHLDAYIQL